MPSPRTGRASATVSSRSSSTSQGRAVMMAWLRPCRITSARLDANEVRLLREMEEMVGMARPSRSETTAMTTISSMSVNPRPVLFCSHAFAQCTSESVDVPAFDVLVFVVSPGFSVCAVGYDFKVVVVFSRTLVVIGIIPWVLGKRGQILRYKN